MSVMYILENKEDMALVKRHVNYESDGRGSAD